MATSRTSPGPRRRLGGAVLRRVLTSVTVLAAVVLGPVAHAYFTEEGAGLAAGGTATLSTSSAPTATTPGNSDQVTVTWTAATLSTGHAVQGYYVQRVRTVDQLTAAACGTSATALTTALTCADTGVADGTYRYRVVAVRNSWTSTSALGTSVTVVNDTSVPSISVTSTSPTPNGNGYNNTSPVSVGLTAAPGAGGFAVLTITAWVDGGSPTTTSGSTRSVSVTGDGIHLVSFYATDVRGKVSPTGTDTIRIDRTAPAAPSTVALTAATDTGASQTDRITKLTTPTYTGSAEAGATVVVYDGATVVGTTTAAADGTWSVASTTLAAGSHTVTAKATDLAGNVSAASASATVVVDLTAPAAPSTPVLPAASDSGRSSTDKITKIASPAMTGTSEASATVTLFRGTTVIGTGTATTGGAWSVSASLTEGTNAITARASDLAGNQSASSSSVTVTLDTNAPAAPSTPVLTAASDTGSSTTDGITRDTTPTVTGTTEANAIVTMYANTTQVYVSGSLTGGSYSATSSALANGSFNLTLTATDVAGNVSVASAAKAIVVDTVAPTSSAPTLTVASDTGISSTDRITRLQAITMTGTSEAGATVSLRNGNTTVGTGTAVGGTYTITSSTLAAGNRTMTARAVDLAGNTGSISSSTVVTIDITSPTVTINQASGQADPARGTVVNFTAVFSETVYGFVGGDVTIGGTAGATTATPSGTGPTYTVGVSGMVRAGTVIASIIAGAATDTAGNNTLASTSSDNTVTWGP